MSKYYLTPEIKPQINKMGNVAYNADDVLFDWTAFEIPVGTCALRSLTVKVMGTEAVAANAIDVDLYFAKSINGVAPPTLGDANDAKNIIKTSAVKPYIMAYLGIDASELEDSLDSLVGYNIFGQGIGGSPDPTNKIVMLEGEPAYNSTQGYQTIWVACLAGPGAQDFGTGCIVAGAHSADDLTIVIDGVDADDVFAIGDTLIAFDADGSGETTIGNVTAVAADLITVDAAPNIIADDDEICNLSPITFQFGFEY